MMRIQYMAIHAISELEDCHEKLDINCKRHISFPNGQVHIWTMNLFGAHRTYTANMKIDDFQSSIIIMLYLSEVENCHEKYKTSYVFQLIKSSYIWTMNLFGA